MRKTIIILVMALLLAAGATEAAAQVQEDRLASVGFNMHGYYRVRYSNFFDLSWISQEKDDDSDFWSWIDQRMILQPTMIIVDPLTINMELDLLNNVMFGDNDIVRQPVVVTERKPNDLETIDYVSFDTLDFNTGSLFSQSMSNTTTDGEEVDPIQIRQLYMRLSTPIGYFRVGRQSSHFGMGLFANSGSPYLRFLEPVGSVNDPNSGFQGDGGDYYDRILFATRVKNLYYPMLVYDRLAEDSFKTGENDVHAFAFVNQFRDITFADSGRFDAGCFLESRTQHATSATVWIYDLWLRLSYAGFNFETEALAVQGKAKFVDRDTVRDLEEAGLPTGERGGEVTANAYLGAAKFNYDSGRWGAGGEGGFSSPADPDPDNEFDAAGLAEIDQAKQVADADPDNASKQIDFMETVINNQAAFGRNLSTFHFDPNYNVDLILWDRLMGGSVVNGAYLKVGGFVRPLDGMYIRLNVINSYINEAWQDKDGYDASHDLGWEFDLNFAYTAYKYFTWDMDFGYFLPGKYFDDVYDDVENVYMLQMRTIVDF